MEPTLLGLTQQNIVNVSGYYQNNNTKNNNKKKSLILQKKSLYFDKMRKILISIPYQVTITIFTIYSLFADDIRVILFQKKDDIIFDCINLALIFIFTLQAIISSIVTNKYFMSFFFILDVISTISLLFDVSLFTNVVYSSSFSNYTFSQVAAQSKASRAAIRAVRIVKLFRIIRIVKLYKAALKAQQIKQNNVQKQLLKQKMKQKYNKKSQGQQSSSNVSKKAEIRSNNNKIIPQQLIKSKSRRNKISFLRISVNQITQIQQINEQKVFQQQQVQLLNNDFLDQLEKNQSKIRKLMVDSTLKKVIIVVLSLMFISPLFDTEIYFDSADSLNYNVQNLNNMLLNNILTTNQINIILNKVLKDHQSLKYFLIYFSTPFKQLSYYKDYDFQTHRVSNFIASSHQINIAQIMKIRKDLSLRDDFVQQGQKNTILAILDNKEYNLYQSYLNIGRTLFICLLLIALLHFFNNDIQELIVQPIQQMMQKLENMAKDPESVSKQMIISNGQQLQTTVISNAIVKIGTLLSIVFGSAGAQIIGRNILQQGDMNPMIQGKKKCAIFGFCDIRKFTQINQILQQDILLFVNKISSVVHKSVYRYGGSANKNIGQAFLLVWKIPTQLYTINNKNNQIKWHNKEYLGILADFSLFSFIKCLIKINKLPEILQYQNDFRLTQHIPNFKVQMGFGLHIGWAIQGAIGSEFKIDASYLSPNVNMASRLEAATKQFGVNLLISQSLYDALTLSLQNFCRNIDRVTVKGSNKPLRLYTVDMNLANISPPADKCKKYPNIPDYEPDINLKREINLQFLKPQQILNYDAKKFIDSKKQFRQILINVIPIQFKKGFQEGLRCYLGGKWNDAKLHFTNALKYYSNDGPTKKLLNYMKNYDFIAPQDWANYRQLTSK